MSRVRALCTPYAETEMGLIARLKRTAIRPAVPPARPRPVRTSRGSVTRAVHPHSAPRSWLARDGGSRQHPSSVLSLVRESRSRASEDWVGDRDARRACMAAWRRVPPGCARFSVGAPGGGSVLIAGLWRVERTIDLLRLELHPAYIDELVGEHGDEKTLGHRPSESLVEVALRHSRSALSMTLTAANLGSALRGAG